MEPRRVRANVWAGGAWGGTNRDGQASHSTSVDIGGWYRVGELEASASLSRVRTGDVPLLQAAGIFPADENDFSDLNDIATETAIRAWADRARRDRKLSQRCAHHRGESECVLHFSAIWQISRRYSFAVGTGRLLADPVRGVPDMQLTTAAIRIALVPLKSPAAQAAARGTSFATVTQKSSGALFLLVRVVADDSLAVEDRGHILELGAGAAHTHPAMRRDSRDRAAAGTPSRWQPVRINGGPWQAPRGTARIRDEFGGEAGLIVVP